MAKAKFLASSVGVLLAAAVLLSGCGVDQSPVASDLGGEKMVLAPEDGDLAPAAKKVKADKSTREAEKAARKAEKEQARAEKKAAKKAEREQAKADRKGENLELGDGETARETDTQTIGPAGGRLTVGYLFGEGAQDDLIAQLRVPKCALDEAVEITMSIYEEDEHLVLEFQPGDLVFNKKARLFLKVGEDHVGVLETLMAWHESEDGSVDRIRIRKVRFLEDQEEGGKYYAIMLKAPGLSRYSLGGDEWTWINGF